MHHLAEIEAEGAHHLMLKVCFNVAADGKNLFTSVTVSMLVVSWRRRMQRVSAFSRIFLPQK